jgi:hypothetical protein
MCFRVSFERGFNVSRAAVVQSVRVELERWEAFLAVNGNGATNAERIRSLGGFGAALRMYRGGK